MYVLMPITTQRTNDEDREYFEMLRAEAVSLAFDPSKTYAAVSEGSPEHLAARRVRMRDFLQMAHESIHCMESVGGRPTDQYVDAVAWRDGMFLVQDHVYEKHFS
jgi:hypothetical protein